MRASFRICRNKNVLYHYRSVRLYVLCCTKYLYLLLVNTGIFCTLLKVHLATIVLAVAR